MKTKSPKCRLSSLAKGLEHNAVFLHEMRLENQTNIGEAETSSSVDRSWAGVKDHVSYGQLATKVCGNRNVGFPQNNLDEKEDFKFTGDSPLYQITPSPSPESFHMRLSGKLFDDTLDIFAFAEKICFRC